MHLPSLKRVQVSSPPSHLAAEGALTPSFSASSSSRSLCSPPLPFSIYPGRLTLWILTYPDLRCPSR